MSHDLEFDQSDPSSGRRIVRARVLLFITNRGKDPTTVRRVDLAEKKWESYFRLSTFRTLPLVEQGASIDLQYYDTMRVEVKPGQVAIFTNEHPLFDHENDRVRLFAGDYSEVRVVHSQSDKPQYINLEKLRRDLMFFSGVSKTR